MKKSIRYLIVTGSFILLLSCLFSLAVLQGGKAYAEEVHSFSAEKYTETDYLLNEDGTDSEKMLRDYAKELKMKPEDEPITDLDKIIPVEYLRVEQSGAAGDEKQFSYMGKEYGFFVKHRLFDPYQITYGIDIVLIDFKQSYNKDTGEAYFEVRPILNESFWHRSVGGEDVWYRAKFVNVAGSEGLLYVGEEYFISNPVITTAVLNEHELNYGDAGYSKANDTGNIISQARVNYNAVQLNNATIVPLVNMSVRYLVASIPVVGQYVDLGLNLRDSLEEIKKGMKENVSATDENLAIFQNESKEVQRLGGSPYTRAMSMQADQSFLLSSKDLEEDHYFRGITVLDNTDACMRMKQVCSFDIITRKGSSVTYHNNQNEEGTRVPFQAVSESVLQEEYGCQTISLQEEDNAYFLPNGTSTYLFTPAFTGEYTLKSSAAAADFSVRENGTEIPLLSELDAEEICVLLEAGKTYLIDFSLTDRTAYGQFPFIITFPSIEKDRSVTVSLSAGKIAAYSFTVPQSGYYRFDFGSAINSAFIGRNGQFGESAGKKNYGYFLQDERYSVILSSSQSLSLTVYFTEVDALTLGEEMPVFSYENVYYASYRNNSNALKNYVVSVLTDSDQAALIWEIKDANNDTLLATILDSYRSAMFEIPAKTTVYIGVFSSDVMSDAKIVLREEAAAHHWIVDGVPIEGDTLRLARGASVKIGFQIGNVEKGLMSKTNDVFSISNSRLTVKADALLGAYEYVAADGLPSGYSYAHQLKVYAIMEKITDITVETGGTSDGKEDEITLKWGCDAITEIRLTFLPVSGEICSVTLGNLLGKNEFYFVEMVRTDKYEYTNFFLDRLSIFGGACVIQVDWVKLDPLESASRSAYQILNHTDEMEVADGSCTPYFKGGSGTASAPYLLSGIQQLYNIRYDNDAHYLMTGSMFFHLGIAWTPIPEFRGVLIGDFRSFLYPILDVSVTNIGIFGVNRGTIRNVKLIGVRNDANWGITSRTFYYGGLVGINYGVIDNCTNSSDTLSLQGYYNACIGNFVGKNSGGTIRKASTSNLLTGSGYVGGIVGRNEAGGTVEDCSCSGYIEYVWTTANRSMGGLIGYNDNATVKNNRFSGKIVWVCEERNKDILPSIGLIVGYNTGGTFFENDSEDATYHIDCESLYVIIMIWDQSGRVMKKENGQVGWEE